MEQRLTIVGLGVADLKISTKFYTETLGWELHPSSHENITFIQLGGILFSLYPNDKLAEDAGVSPRGSGFKGFTLAHNLRSANEVDNLIQELRSKGVTIVKEPEKVFWGGYSSYIADPDGHLWELAHNPFLELDKKGFVAG